MFGFANSQSPAQDRFPASAWQDVVGQDRAEPLPDVLRALPVSLAISGGMWLFGLAVFIVEWYRM